MSAKDIANTSTYIDTVAKYLLENAKSFSESKNGLPIPGIQKGCFRFQEKAELFKAKCINSEQNPLSFLASLEQSSFPQLSEVQEVTREAIA